MQCNGMGYAWVTEDAIFVGPSTVDRDLNQYKIVVPLFGAAYAAPNKGTTILYICCTK